MKNTNIDYLTRKRPLIRWLDKRRAELQIAREFARTPRNFQYRFPAKPPPIRARQAYALIRGLLGFELNHCQGTARKLRKVTRAKVSPKKRPGFPRGRRLD